MSMNGNYELVVNSPMGKQTIAMTLEVDGNNVTKLEASGDKGSATISNPKVEGNILTFIAAVPGTPMKITFNLVIEGDELSGQAKAIMGSFAVTGKRVVLAD